MLTTARSAICREFLQTPSTPWVAAGRLYRAASQAAKPKAQAARASGRATRWPGRASARAASHWLRTIAASTGRECVSVASALGAGERRVRLGRGSVAPHASARPICDGAWLDRAPARAGSCRSRQRDAPRGAARRRARAARTSRTRGRTADTAPRAEAPDRTGRSLRRRHPVPAGRGRAASAIRVRDTVRLARSAGPVPRRLDAARPRRPADAAGPRGPSRFGNT